MYAEMQQLLHDDGGVIVLVFNNYVERQFEEAGPWRHRAELGGRWAEDRGALVVRLTAA